MNSFADECFRISSASLIANSLGVSWPSSLSRRFCCANVSISQFPLHGQAWYCLASALDQQLECFDSRFQLTLLHGFDQDVRQVSDRIRDPWINHALSHLIDRFRHE